jgi:hypothetical protein
MQKIRLKKDIHLVCVQAKNYPFGITDAFRELEDLSPEICSLPFYGLTFTEVGGNIIYKAGVDRSLIRLTLKKNCENFIIRKGQYLSETHMDFMDDNSVIQISFSRMFNSVIAQINYPFIEWYRSPREVTCMVRCR